MILRCLDGDNITVVKIARKNTQVFLMELLQQIMWDCGSLSSGAIEFLVYMYINLFAYFENLHNKYFLMHLNV